MPCARGLLHSVRKRLPVGMAATGARAIAESANRFDSSAGGGEPTDLIMTAEQRSALERVAAAIAAGGFAPFLIHGVTGSGKTEVYLAAIEKVVALGREAIVLVPEISLTPQTIRAVPPAFRHRVAVLHSHLSDAERHRYWQSIASGEVQVIVGVARPSLRRRGDWASLSSTKNMKAPSNKRRRRDTMRATSPSSVRRWRGFRCSWARRRLRSKAGGTPSAGDTH